MKIAKDIGLGVYERDIDLSELVIADEIFASGTSAGVSSVFEVDARKIGDVKTNEITSHIRKKYFDILYGRDKSYSDLLTSFKYPDKRHCY